MYLASFDTGFSQTLQGCVRFPHQGSVVSSATESWWKEYRRLLLSFKGIEGGTTSLRVLSRASEVLERVLIVSAPAPEEAALRRQLASLSCLEEIAEGSVVLPRHREEHDAIMENFPDYQCHVAVPSYCREEVWFACDFRIAWLLEELISEAERKGYGFCYQGHVRHLSIDSMWLRDALRNALRVRDLRGVPETVIQMQRQLAERLENASAIYEEFLAVDTPEAGVWLSDALQRDFRRQFAPLKFDTPKFEFAKGAHSDILSAALHTSTFIELHIDEVCAGAISDEERTGLLGWRPSAELSKRFISQVSPRKKTEDELPSPTLFQSSPTPYDGRGSFIFVSYARRDFERVALILERLIRQGHNIWYDKGIPGGAEWDAFIEGKLAGCACVLLFISPASISSKHVRREVKFADTLDKPIVSVLLEETSFSRGMNMLLSQYQMLDSTSGDFENQLFKAIQHSSRAASEDM